MYIHIHVCDSICTCLYIFFIVIIVYFFLVQNLTIIRHSNVATKKIITIEFVIFFDVLWNVIRNFAQRTVRAKILRKISSK